MLLFIDKSVLVYENKFLHFRRKHIRFLDICHNSAHKGTNHRAKSHAIAVLPSQNLLSSAKRLVMQGITKDSKIYDKASIQCFKNNNYSVLPTAGKVTPIAKGILQDIADSYHHYIPKYVGSKQFEVVLKKSCYNKQDSTISDNTISEESLVDEDGQISITTCPKPSFWRVRKVFISEEHIIYCSCMSFERTGLPCVHMFCVYKLLDPNWNGFTYEDVSVRW